MARTLNVMRGICVLAIVCAVARSASAISIVFDYRFDTQHFFDVEPRRVALQAAADVFEIFTDNLASIVPSGGNTWTARFDHPGKLQTEATIVDMSVSAGAVIVFVGGKNHSGSTIGFGGPGGYNSTGTITFNNNLATRGQANSTGSMPTDFARWGGAISFDTLTPGGQPRNWHADLTTPPPAGAQDLYTVAVHELAHVLGFAIGSQEPFSFQTYWNQASKQFTGPKVVEVYGGNAPTASNGSAHWQSGVASTVGSVSQATVMGPSIPTGVRRQFTALDYAAMADIGWQVPDSVFAVPLPGDYDGNAIVNSNDYSIWRNSFGSTTNLAADGNGNGRVDAADYVMWRDHFGATGGSGAGTAPVPELPGTIAGILASLCLGMGTRSSRQRGASPRHKFSEKSNQSSCVPGRSPR